MPVVQGRFGEWAYRRTVDCFGDEHDSFYHWETRKQAEKAEKWMLRQQQATKDFNEGLISLDQLQEIRKEKVDL